MSDESISITNNNELEPPSISMWKVFIVGLGFGTTALVWTLYNNAIPVFLSDNYHMKYIHSRIHSILIIKLMLSKYKELFLSKLIY